MIKKEKLKMRKTKIKKPIDEDKPVTDINLKLTGSQFLPVFTETLPEVERNRIK